MQHKGLIVGLLNDDFQRHSLLRKDQETDGQPPAMKMEQVQMVYTLLLPLMTTYRSIRTIQFVSYNYQQTLTFWCLTQLIQCSG